jgi:hypothetical protein
VRTIGKAELTTVDRGKQLEFASGYQSGWVDFLAPPAALFIVFLWAMIAHFYLIAWFVVVGYLLLVLWWLHSPVTRLLVTDTELVARGNLGRSYSDTRRVKTEDLKSLGHFHGAHNEPAGLYAYHDWSKTCLIPRLTPQESNAIVAAIHRKFPDIEHGHEIEMEAIHAEANGDFHPHVQLLEVDPLEDLRHWKAAKAQEMEVDDFRAKPLKAAQDLESK